MAPGKVRTVAQPVKTPIGTLTLDEHMAPTRKNPDGPMLNREQADNAVFQFLSLVIPDFPNQLKLDEQSQECKHRQRLLSDLQEKVSHNWHGLRFLVPSFNRLADGYGRAQDASWDCQKKYDRLTGLRKLAMAVARYSVAAKDAWPKDYNISGAELLLACDRALEFWQKDLGSELSRLSAGVDFVTNPLEDRADEIEGQAEILYR